MQRTSPAYISRCRATTAAGRRLSRACEGEIGSAKHVMMAIDERWHRVRKLKGPEPKKTSTLASAICLTRLDLAVEMEL